jgi:large subunit ribosomal protein L15
MKIMRLNTLSPAVGSKKIRLRVGRGASAGQGKTCGRGVKGQRARKGGYHKVGFEGGQMPLQRRLPKRGFLAVTIEKAAEVRSGDLARVGSDTIDLESLKKAGLVHAATKRAKIILAGSVDKKFSISGVAASKGAREAIEKAGGKVAELVVVVPPKKLPKKSQPAAK